MKIVSIIQARMSSSRLPGKVLLDIAGKPMLERVFERLKLSQKIDLVVVATTSDPSDDQLAKFCQAKGVPCFRGSLFDVLDRYYQAAQYFEANVVVRITADCPLIDPKVVDHTIQEFFKTGSDFATNRLPPPWKRTYPIGLDTEVCSFAALQRAWKEARQDFEREHVMPYFYDQEGRFKVHVVNHDPDYGSKRWTVDTAKDLELVREIYTRFEGKEFFGWEEVLRLFELEPELAMINADVSHKTALDVDERLKK
jgi:spore coat polysaccharide biosynthesis protein SpsF